MRKQIVSEEIGIELHKRAMQKDMLSAKERLQLEDWYAVQDEAEMEMLGLLAATEPLESLKVQVDLAVAQVTSWTKRLQEISAENEILRRENAELRRQLEVSLQPA